MPIYEYQCQSCGHAFETMQRLADAPLALCPKCEGPLKKLISAPAFQFKGSGWYVTDYSRSGGGKSGPSTEAGGKSESGGGETKTETKTTESSATKAPTKAESSSASPKPSSSSD
jgi:putative FmdB family regulatory protein